MTLLALLCFSLAVLTGFISGVFFAITKLAQDYVIANRLLATYDPTGLYELWRHNPGLLTVVSFGAALMFFTFGTLLL